MSHSDMSNLTLVMGGLLLMALLISPGMAYNLSIEKNVTTSEPYYIGDDITWVITVYNAGNDPVNVTVFEDTSGLKNVTWISNSSPDGIFNATTSVWNITGLAPGETALLTIVTSFAYPEQQTNVVNITEINATEIDDITEVVEGTLTATKTISIGNSVTATLEIKPETLNLKSKGTFTVFINVSGVFDGQEIDVEGSSITCNESVLRKLTLAGDTKMIAKFERTSLNVTANDSVTISCAGEVKVGEEIIRVVGSDAIRVIKEKPADTFIDKILKFLGLKNDANNEENQVLIDAIPETVNNIGQAKKYLKENPVVAADSDESENPELIDQENDESEVNSGGKPEKEPKDNTPPVTECNQGNCKGGKNKNP
jgi:uncharacterized repeat protein (TIGR01451 family)